MLYIKGNHDEKFDFDIDLPSNFIILDEERPFYKLDNKVFWGPKSKEALKGIIIKKIRIFFCYMENCTIKATMII